MPTCLALGVLMAMSTIILTTTRMIPFMVMIISQLGLATFIVDAAHETRSEPNLFRARGGSGFFAPPSPCRQCLAHRHTRALFRVGIPGLGGDAQSQRFTRLFARLFGGSGNG